MLGRGEGSSRVHGGGWDSETQMIKRGWISDVDVRTAFSLCYPRIVENDTPLDVLKTLWNTETNHTHLPIPGLVRSYVTLTPYIQRYIISRQNSQPPCRVHHNCGLKRPNPVSKPPFSHFTPKIRPKR